MPHPLIDRYHTQLAKAVQFGKSTSEESIKSYCWVLLNAYAEKQNLQVVREVFVEGTKGKRVKPDGVLNNSWGLTLGHWESKDEADDLEEEIDIKLKKGYPFTNILFEDSKTAVLYQYGEQVGRASMRDSDKLHALLLQWLSYKSAVVTDFEKALENFKADIPILLDRLQGELELASGKNKDFIAARDTFLALCRAEINPEVSEADVREMLIQHLLTAELFQKIFDEPDFHRENNIAHELEQLLGTVFTRERRKNLLASIEHYYDAINSTAAGITDHHEKQKFLKVLYENFYKAYNPKAADRLGVVYTPNEIVRFMVRSTDHLLHQHFGRSLSDKNVDILDPATGTGTFICDLIDHIRPDRLAQKYMEEIHANEIAILPYYVANLNIEFTYKQKMREYRQFPNLCFVDTLDNTGGLAYGGKQHDLFGLSSENAARIKRQNDRKISVVIGNPPYSAKQENYNFQNSNRAYPLVDKRIKDTYIRQGTAQNQIVVYDSYTRFYRWAMDRVDRNGIIAFITNRSFIDSRALDGFRKCVQDEFAYAYIIDTHSDVRANPKIAGTTHNVFGIQTGVAVMFLVRKEQKSGPCKIFYAELDEDWRKEEKWEWFRVNDDFEKVPFRQIAADKKNNWINQTDNDFDSLLPLVDKEVKAGKSERALFKLFTSGIKTQRDEWMYDDKADLLGKKVRFLITEYEAVRNNRSDPRRGPIKWDRELTRYRDADIAKTYHKEQVIPSAYRPFVNRFLYFDRHLNAMQYQMASVFGGTGASTNRVIGFMTAITRPFSTLGFTTIFDLNCLSPAAGGTFALPLFSCEKDGTRRENLTDWGLAQFTTHYADGALRGKGSPEIKKEDVFHYVYAVLHDPAYRAKYKVNLKREFPRIPFCKDFWQWAKWGKQLMDLHIGYESAEPYPLEVLQSRKTERHKEKKQLAIAEGIAAEPQAMFARQPKVKVKLKAIKEAGVIELDELTLLKGIPKEAWDYKLGNRSALEWVLDQYKEKTPKDPTIREKFNTYRFADHKSKVIDLLKRVTTVSVGTMEVMREMEKASR